jgi:hypothetical protein
MQFAEEDTLLAAGIDLSADVLKVGNHGNPDATSDAFASAVSPSLAMISTDTSVDTNSANHRVIASLSGAEVFLTEDYPLGILLTLDDNGNPMVTNPIQQEDSLQLALFALEPDSQLLTLLNYGDTPADLSGCIPAKRNLSVKRKKIPSSSIPRLAQKSARCINSNLVQTTNRPAKHSRAGLLFSLFRLVRGG